MGEKEKTRIRHRFPVRLYLFRVPRKQIPMLPKGGTKFFTGRNVISHPKKVLLFGVQCII